MIFNLGSINADYVYDLPHLPEPGETLASVAFRTALGGKGANQSVAIARAGGDITHIGSVGADGTWAVEALRDYGVNTHHITRVDAPTGHAIVMVDRQGENQIVICSGANFCQSLDHVKKALTQAKTGDWLILQNETSHQVEAARLAHDLGLRVAYSAAPFDAEQVSAIAPYCSLLIMNEVELGQLLASTGGALQDLAVKNIVVTKGVRGSEWHDTETGRITEAPAFKVDPINTTGAGDTFAGYLVAGLDQGLSVDDALKRANAAAAISTTKPGIADAIPAVSDVQEFLDQ